MLGLPWSAPANAGCGCCRRQKLRALSSGDVLPGRASRTTHGSAPDSPRHLCGGARPPEQPACKSPARLHQKPSFLPYPGVNAFAWGFYRQASSGGTTNPCDTRFWVATTTDPAVGSFPSQFSADAFPTTMNTMTYGMGDYIGGTPTTNPTSGQLFFTYGRPTVTTDATCPTPCVANCPTCNPIQRFSTAVFGVRATP
jgi:hypothetical protein